jgi:hypothetical protein
MEGTKTASLFLMTILKLLRSCCQCRNQGGNPTNSGDLVRGVVFSACCCCPPPVPPPSPLPGEGLEARLANFGLDPPPARTLSLDKGREGGNAGS